ncbi:hypothetical protein [Xenorhabdus sp. IM139775]|uniref:hypothetical protein n=1 Tax=Xenorhabdus sp. IM139775 TaxID=3025876 RepID=UPI00235A36E0|nr:hypothetical protein [Xenorhabdus sp. IM139775]MDC9594852.1 hypothetical protein [Xenorhabdus sp. IM139775]
MNNTSININENEILPLKTPELMPDPLLMVPYAVSTPGYEWDASAIIKDAIIGGIGFIPGPGPAMSFLLGLFWPQQADNTWEQILQKVEQMIEDARARARTFFDLNLYATQSIIGRISLNSVLLKYQSVFYLHGSFKKQAFMLSPCRGCHVKNHSRYIEWRYTRN